MLVPGRPDEQPPRPIDPTEQRAGVGPVRVGSAVVGGVMLGIGGLLFIAAVAWFAEPTGDLGSAVLAPIALAFGAVLGSIGAFLLARSIRPRPPQGPAPSAGAPKRPDGAHDGR